MSNKHSWERLSYFKFNCKKCGCEKEQQAETFPPTYQYLLDGKLSNFAPVCDNRFIPKKPAEQLLFDIPVLAELARMSHRRTKTNP